MSSYTKNADAQVFAEVHARGSIHASMAMALSGLGIGKINPNPRPSLGIARSNRAEITNKIKYL